MKKSLLVTAAVFVSALAINSNPVIAQSRTDQELAKENLELRQQNAELRDRLRRLEPRAALSNTNRSHQQPSISSQAAAARAADLPTKAPPAPPPTPTYTWSGFYVGGNVGGAWGHRDVAYVLDLISLGTFDTPPGPASFKTSGVIGGVQVGYNWQFHRNWLIGQESDFNWSGMKGSGSSAAAVQLGPVASPIPFVAAADEHIRWFGTFRARLGYLPTDNLLAYVTGGFAYGKVERTGTLTRGGTGTFTVTGGGFGIQCTAGIPCYAGGWNDVTTGWTLGGGLEYAFWQRWTLKAEYLYVSLDGKSFTETATNPPPGFLPAAINANLNRPTFNVARVGVNYRF